MYVSIIAVNEERKHYPLVNLTQIVADISFTKFLFFLFLVCLKWYSVPRCPCDDLDWFWLPDDVPQEVQPERCWSDFPCRCNSRPGGFNLRWRNKYAVRP